MSERDDLARAYADTVSELTAAREAWTKAARAPMRYLADASIQFEQYHQATMDGLMETLREATAKRVALEAEAKRLRQYVL